mmetsp:Transcript_69231/g.144314  ORF Transcript_69231/g.144314 Transcript_69231/m.144314 type:complete len:87 (-) Transcript_69231:47-307(-)
MPDLPGFQGCVPSFQGCVAQSAGLQELQASLFALHRRRGLGFLHLALGNCLGLGQEKTLPEPEKREQKTCSRRKLVNKDGKICVEV